jgi:Tol biopolymer transport system component
VRVVLAAAVAALLAGAGGSANGAPAHGRIAFGLEHGSVTSLYTVRPDGSGPRRVTVPPTRQDLGGDSGPVWSPDGRRLVFERNLPYWGNDRFRLNAVRATGGIARPLTQGPFDVMPTVSPDGKRIAFTRVVSSVVAPTISLFTSNARGQRPAQLLAGGFDLSPAWSPDGRTIAFTRLASDTAPIEEAELFLAAADGSNVRPLGPGVRGVSPAWSPDGRRLAFVSFADRNGASCPASNCAPSGELYVVNADGTGLRRLTRSRADDEHPTWSPNGARIAFASGFVLPKEGHRPWLMTMPAAGGRAVRIGRFTGVLDPAWSPAGIG